MLWRMLLVDLLRLLVATTISLVGVLAFAAAIRPLADGQVELSGALLLMGLAIVPMLQFALPFAAGFASTLGYHRFASDREFVAASVGGLSHRTLLAPAAACGLFVGGTMAYLLNETVPEFLRSMERIVTRDATQLVQASVERGESVQLGPFDLHAREVVELEPEPDSGALSHLVLTDVLAVRAGPDGRVNSYSSAERVDVWLFEDAEDPQSTIVQFAFRGAFARGESDLLGRQNFATKRLRIAGSFREDPKFLRFGELRRAYEHPERLGKVDALRRQLAAQVEANLIVRDLADRLARGERIWFRRSGLAASGVDTEDRFVLSGGAALTALEDGWRLVPMEGVSQIRLDISLTGQERLQLANEVVLRFETDARAVPGRESTARFVLELRGVSTVDLDGVGGDAELERMVYGELQAEGVPERQTPGLGVDALVARARELADDPLADRARLLEAAEDLQDKAQDVRREILSKQHERAAFAVAGLIMVLTGSVMGLRLGESLPLPVYLWSFLPALLATVTISAGQGLVHKSGAGWLALLWGGVLALLLYTIGQYARLHRH